MLSQFSMKLSGSAVFTTAAILNLFAAPTRTHAVPLLAVDFGTAENYVQPGFSAISGTAGQSTASARSAVTQSIWEPSWPILINFPVEVSEPAPPLMPLQLPKMFVRYIATIFTTIAIFRAMVFRSRSPA